MIICLDGESMKTTAEHIMKRKGHIKAEMNRQLSFTDSEECWARATALLDHFLKKYASLPEGVHFHTDVNIFPVAAVYLAVKERVGADVAYSIIENAAIYLCESYRPKIDQMMKLPGMNHLFVKIWDPLTKKVFGESGGFQNRFYENRGGEYRMDVLACPYHRFFTELGCPELTKIFCENDERIYGGLRDVKFERTGTIGTGSPKCDFCVRVE